jgi:hypothetical protein
MARSSLMRLQSGSEVSDSSEQRRVGMLPELSITPQMELIDWSS